jgi:hypothetical protein
MSYPHDCEQESRIEKLNRRIDTLLAFNTGQVESRERAERKIGELLEEKHKAYWERNQLVAALSKFFPASLERHPESDKDWDNDWRWVVYIDAPTGQLTWHIHDSHLGMFDHLPRLKGRIWDGHSTPQKYDRLRNLIYVDRTSLYQVTLTADEMKAEHISVIFPGKS